MCYIEKEKLGEIKQSDQDRNREGRTSGIGNAERSLHVNNLGRFCQGKVRKEDNVIVIAAWMTRKEKSSLASLG